MAIQVRADTQYVNDIASGATITKPAGTAAGDLLLLHARLSNSVQRILPPDGFALIHEDSAIRESPSIFVYAKRAGASEPASYEIVHNTSLCSVGLVALQSDTGDYLALDNIAGQSNASSDTVEWPGVTTTVANTVLLCFASLSTTRDLNTPGGMTRRYPNASTASYVHLYSEAIASAGATGTRSTTTVSGFSTFSKVISLAIREQADPGDSRVTQAGAYSENTSDELRVTQAGAYAEIIRDEIRVTQAGVYLEVLPPQETVFRRPALVDPLKTHLFFLQPTTVLSAQVAMDTIVYPIDTVFIDSVTGNLNDLIVGMTVIFGTTAGGSDLGRTYIRRIPQQLDGDALIHIGLCSRGVRDGEIDISDGVHVTVLDDYRVWAKPQVFVPNGLGGVDIFKDGGEPVWRFVGGGQPWTSQPPPVANSGPGLAAYAVGGSFEFPMSATGSFAVADGATITGYAWFVGDGTITNNTATDPAIRVEFPPGFRWVTLFITDSNNRTHRSKTPVLVVDPDDDVTIRHEIVRQHLTAERQELSVRILDDIPADTYPDGTLVMLWEGEASGTNALPGAYEHMRFVGWLDTQQANIAGAREGTLRNTTVECLDVAGRLQQLPGYAQELEHVTSNVNAWYKMPNPSIFKYIHYLLHWHSTALDVADWLQVPQGAGNVAADAADYDFVVLGSAASDLLDQVRTVARSLVPDYAWVTNIWGQMYLRIDPMLLDTGDRTNQFAGGILDASRWSVLEFTHQPAPRTRAVYGGAILAGHTTPLTPVFARAPGDTVGQGLNELREENQLAQSHADLISAEGHRYARLNAPESRFRLTMARPGELWTDTFSPQHFQPAGVRWVRVTLPAEVAAQRGLSFTEARFLMHAMTLTYDYRREGVQRSVELEMERETSGTPAVAYTLDVPMGWTPEIWLRGGILEANVAAAYEPFHAENLAASLVNLNDPGTNDASSGDQPTLSDGWVFNGTDQYLATGIVPASGYAMIAAFSNASGAAIHTLAGSVTDTGSAFYLVPRDNNNGGARRYYIGNTTVSVTGGEELESGIMGIDGTHAWLDASRESASAGAWTTTSSHGITIGARNNAGVIDQWLACTLTHLYIYTQPLTPYQIYAVMTGIQADLER